MEKQDKPENASLVNLTPIDLDLIERQCELQGATEKYQIEGMTRAYKEAKTLSRQPEKLSAMSGDDWLELVDHYAKLIEPEKNQHGYRIVEVRFTNGNRGMPHNQIGSAMERLFDFYSEGQIEPIELYREFETIHPYTDGNGRVGHLLWAVAEKRQSGKWPEELPPNVF